MVTEIKMPRYGWTMTEGKIVRWLKREGDPIKSGEAIFEIETEKVETEVEALASGILSKILVSEGTVVSVGQPIGIISESGEKPPSLSPTMGDLEVEPKTTEAVPSDEGDTKPLPKRELRVSPLAKRLAEQYGIDVNMINGSGPEGRIVKEDILKAAGLQKKGLEIGPKQELREKIMPLTGTRKVIADRMAQSAKATARVLYTIEVDMSRTVKFRQSLLEEIEEKAKVRLSLTDIIVRAVAKALEQHPIMNSILLEDGVHLIEDINIGVAVALENNLLVPVVHNANKKSLLEIATQLTTLVEQAEKGELSAKETTRGTFTITNPGMLGIDIQMPVINTPENSILGIGTLCDKPVAENDRIVIRPMMRLNLVFDHRVIDGAPAAKFLQTLKSILENPDNLLQ